MVIKDIESRSDLLQIRECSNLPNICKSRQVKDVKNFMVNLDFCGYSDLSICGSDEIWGWEGVVQAEACTGSED